MKLPDLEGLALFAKVAEAGAFAKAARDLGISKATISKAISRLETRLGTRLFHRSSRQLALTEAGRGVLSGARDMLSAGEAAEAQALDAAAAPRGLVKLAVPMSFGLAYVAPVIPEFLKAYPDVTVEMDLSDAVVDLVGGGFDAALRIGVLADSALVARRLCDIQVMAIAAPSYLEARGTPQHPREITEHDGMIYALVSTPDLWRFRSADGEEVAVKPRPRLRSNNGDALMAAVREGQGIALLPDFICAEDVAAKRVTPILTGWTMFRSGLHLVTPPGGHRPARVTALIDFLVARFAVAPWRQIKTR
jgi:DNA-binding transcriptional LysR family regulator